MDVLSIVLAPVRIPARIAQALDDLSDIAERARRDPDPVEEVRVRIDALLVELRDVVVVAREIRDGGADLTATAKVMNATMLEMLATAKALRRTAEQLDRTGTAIHDGGEELTATSKTLHVDTRELIDGGERLTEVSEQLEEHMRAFRAALPRILQLEEAVETVAETVEPLQGAAERVGRVTKRLSRT